MKDQNLENEIKKMREELNQLKNKSLSQKFKEKSRLAQGIIIGLSMTAIVAVAGQITKTYNFTSGTAISSAEVNTNFDDLFAKVNDMNIGFLANLSTDQVVTCDAGGAVLHDAEFDTAIIDDGNYNIGTYTYTVPTTGYYFVVANFSNSTGSITISGSAQYGLHVNGAKYKYLYVVTEDVNVIKFNAGDTVTVKVACDTKMNATETAEAAISSFMMRKAF